MREVVVAETPADADAKQAVTVTGFTFLTLRRVMSWG